NEKLRNDVRRPSIPVCRGIDELLEIPSPSVPCRDSFCRSRRRSQGAIGVRVLRHGLRVPVLFELLPRLHVDRRPKRAYWLLVRLLYEPLRKHRLLHGPKRERPTETGLLERILLRLLRLLLQPAIVHPHELSAGVLCVFQRAISGAIFL